MNSSAMSSIVLIIVCCLTISSSGLAINDQGQTGNASSLCLTLSGVSYGASCYIASSENIKMTWSDAFDQCQAHLPAGFYGRLAWFTTKESWEFVYKNWPRVHAHRFWIGLKEVDDRETRDSVYWWKDTKSSGIKVDWAPDRYGVSTRILDFDDVGHKCFRSWNGNVDTNSANINVGWADTSCDNKLRYMCEFVADPCYYLNPCSIGGKCEPDIVTNSPKCTCSTGYEGDFCEKERPSIGGETCEHNVAITVVVTTLVTVVLIGLGTWLFKQYQYKCLILRHVGLKKTSLDQKTLVNNNSFTNPTSPTTMTTIDLSDDPRNAS